MEDRTQNFKSKSNWGYQDGKTKKIKGKRENCVKEKIEKLETQVIIYIEGHTECAESCECNMR